MPRSLLLAIAAPVLLAAQAPPKSVPLPAVGVFMIFDTAPGNKAVDLMKAEVDQLLGPTGLALNWRLASENRGDQSFDGLVVLKFKGSCKAENWPLPSNDFGTAGESHMLGSTAVVNGRVLPYGEVQCDQIRKALAYLPVGSDQKARQKALGLALGRVVAHELYHMLAKTTTHAEHGLAKASQSLEDLISEHEIPFAEDDTRAIHEAVAK
jgi:hypothetical protein